MDRYHDLLETTTEYQGDKFVMPSTEKINHDYPYQHDLEKHERILQETTKPSYSTQFMDYLQSMYTSLKNIRKSK